MSGLEKKDFYAPDTENFVLFDESRKIKAATFPKLITLLTDAKGVDNALIHDFLLTYRSFASAEGLADALIARFKTADPAEQALVRVRCLNIIKLWILKYWIDFRKETSVGERVLEFLNSLISGEDQSSAKTALNIKETLLRQQSEAGQTKRANAAFKQPPPKPFLPKDERVPLIDWHIEEIARQLTLMEWNIWKDIQPWECLGLAWTKKDKEERAPHETLVLALIERFNYVSGWVATTMCMEEKPSDRLKWLKKFVDIAVKLRQIGNFNGVLEIISGLNRGPVFRLKQTFEQLEQKDNKRFLQLEELRLITNRERNYAELRRAFKGMEPPIIPYLGMYLTDLTFIEEGNKDEMNGLVNFYKRRLIADTIKELQTFQLQEYNFMEVSSMQEKLRGETILSEDELYQLSEYIEPRAGRDRPPRPALLGPGEELPATSSAPRSLPTPTAAPLTRSNPGVPATTPALRPATVTLSGRATQEEKDPSKFDLEFKKSWQVFYINDNPSNVVVAPNGHLIAATLPKIIERLTHPTQPDTSFAVPFLVTYRTVATPDELLTLLLSRMDLPEPVNKDPGEMARWAAQFRDPIIARTCNLLKHWVTFYWSDFVVDDIMKQMMLDFFQSPITKAIPPSLLEGIKAIYKRNEALQNDPYILLEKAPRSVLPLEDVHPSTCTVLDFDPLEVARQLCLIAYPVVSGLGPEDLIGVQLSSFLDPVSALKDKKSRSDLDSFVSTLIAWVNEEMITAMQYNTVSHVISRLISIATNCLQLNNFFVCKEVFNALNFAIDQAYERDPVMMPNAMSRLTQTERMSFFDLKELFSPKGLPQLMNNMSKAVSPAILTTQEFQNRVQAVEKTHPKEFLSETLINCEKKRIQGDILFAFTRHKTPYAFYPVEIIQAYLFRQRIEGQVPQVTISPQWSAPPSRPVPAAPVTSDSGKRNSVKDTQSLRNIILDDVLYDPAFKEEIAAIVREVMHEEMENFKESMRRMAITGAFGPLTGHTSPPAQSAFAHIGDDRIRLALEGAFPRATIVTWSCFDENGVVSGDPGQINVDVIQKEQNKYLLGVKDQVTQGDLEIFVKLGILYKQHNPEAALSCVLVTPSIQPDVEDLAYQCKFKILKI